MRENLRLFNMTMIQSCKRENDIPVHEADYASHHVSSEQQNTLQFDSQSKHMKAALQ